MTAPSTIRTAIESHVDAAWLVLRNGLVDSIASFVEERDAALRTECMARVAAALEVEPVVGVVRRPMPKGGPTARDIVLAVLGASKEPLAWTVVADAVEAAGLTRSAGDKQRRKLLNLKIIEVRQGRFSLTEAGKDRPSGDG